MIYNTEKIFESINVKSIFKFTHWIFNNCMLEIFTFAIPHVFILFILLFMFIFGTKYLKNLCLPYFCVSFSVSVSVCLCLCVFVWALAHCLSHDDVSPSPEPRISNHPRPWLKINLLTLKKSGPRSFVTVKLK